MIWIYAQEDQAQAIAEAVAGTTSVGPVLGYPACCVLEDAETKVLMEEAYVEGLTRASITKSPEEVTRLWNQNLKVEVSVGAWVVNGAREAASKLFPYIQFGACRACQKSVDSPASVVNRQMRDLAFSVSPAFGCSIWEARDFALSRGKSSRSEVGRNDLCPCGSGVKFKRCCLPYAGRIATRSV